jgi:nitroimidazol reductase NimA-like FMN-containing flavoprotein (pyridoxamine 5'-phosphate oxidase superfamily)
MGTRRDATPRTSVTRLPELASSDRAALDELLDGSRVGHFGIVVDGFPVVVPTAIARRGDTVLAHGSTGSGWMRGLAAGAPTTLAVTALDGLEVARSAFESSMHYRSAILFGSCRTVDDADEKRAALDAITDSLLPGRVVEVRGPTPKELAATLVLLLPIAEWSLKVSAGWPDDGPADLDGHAWAGIVPLTTGFGKPVPAPDLRAGIEVPASVRRLTAERH